MNKSTIDKTAASLVANLIYQVNGILPKNIKIEDSLIVDLGLDSIEIIDLLMRLEEAGVKIPESDINASLTVENIALLYSKSHNPNLTLSPD